MFERGARSPTSSRRKRTARASKSASTSARKRENAATCRVRCQWLPDGIVAGMSAKAEVSRRAAEESEAPGVFSFSLCVSAISAPLRDFFSASHEDQRSCQFGSETKGSGPAPLSRLPSLIRATERSAGSSAKRTPVKAFVCPSQAEAKAQKLEKAPSWTGTRCLNAPFPIVPSRSMPTARHDTGRET